MLESVRQSVRFVVTVTAVATAVVGCGGSNDGGGAAGAGQILTGGGAGGASGGTPNGGASAAAGIAGSAAGGAPNAGAPGSASGGASTNPNGVPLGSQCMTNTQCGTGMVCLTPSSTVLGGAGPANGLCTLACNTTAECNAVSPGSDCFNLGTSAAPILYCLAGCTVGGTDPMLATTKCQGRGDFSCVDLSTTTTPDAYCLPLCRADLECGAGLFCNKASGLCSKTKAVGDPVGTACAPGAATDTCEGFCLRTSADDVMPAQGACAEFCSGFTDCMYAGDKPGGLCAGALSATFGILDLGYCLPSCNCTGDCPFPGDMCRAWATSEQDFATDLGKPGLCDQNVTGSVELLTCAK